jgi:mRNA-degrading endonuclease RelE of RelBE toxin-antitoxin system
MTWTLRIAKHIEKALQKFPARDREQVALAIQALAENPFAGGIVRLKGTITWRRGAGNYRIFFELDFESHIVDVVDLQRRTSTTY